MPPPGPPLPIIEGVELIFGSWREIGRHWSLVILGDGYPTGEMKFFREHAELVKERLAVYEAPFDRMRSAINIIRMDVVSNTSWNSLEIDDWYEFHQKAIDDADGDPAEQRRLAHELFCQMPPTDTALKARFCRDGLRRSMYGDQKLALRVAQSDARLPPKPNGVLVIVNTSRFQGGSGGEVAWASRYDGFLDRAVHEIGHQAFNLADEYHYNGDHPKRFLGAEPVERNISRSFKPRFSPWVELLTPDVVLPTTIDHEGCKPFTPEQEKIGTYGVKAGYAESIGAFEGAAHHHCGLYRPALNCRMRTEEPFCAVCQQIIVEHLGMHLFGNSRTQPERAIDPASHLLICRGANSASDVLLTYDIGSGGYAMYPCLPFVTDPAGPTPDRGMIAPYWTSLTNVTFDGAPHILAIQTGSGLAALYKVADDGRSITHAWGTANPGFTLIPFGLLQIVPFSFQDELHWLEYDIVTGVATIKRLVSGSAAATNVRAVNLGGRRIGLFPFVLNGEPDVHFYTYDVAGGLITLHRFDQDDVKTVWTSSLLLKAGETDLVPFELSDGSSYILLHSRFTGRVRMFRVRYQGDGLEFVYGDFIGPGPFTFVPFAVADEPRRFYLRYRWPLIPGAAGKIAAFRHG